MVYHVFGHGLQRETKHGLSELQKEEDQGKPIASLVLALQSSSAFVQPMLGCDDHVDLSDLVRRSVASMLTMHQDQTLVSGLP